MAADAPGPGLSEAFERGWRLHEGLERGDDDGGPAGAQVRAREAIALLERATEMVNELQLFSRNESLDEVSTRDLRYLLLPALLGSLSQRVSEGAARAEALKVAAAYHRDFLRRARSYGVRGAGGGRGDQVREEEEEEGGGDGRSRELASVINAPPNLAAMAERRREKIERYRMRKEAEERLAILRAARAGGADDEDDDAMREELLLQLQRWAARCRDEVDSIASELPLLQHAMHRQQVGAPARLPRPHGPPTQPLVLTRNDMQSRVLGLGYPARPVMSVQQWYDGHQQRGMLPDQGIAANTIVSALPDGGDVERGGDEAEEQEEDEEALRRARNWDDWKDTHRTGWGNRKNMG